MNARNLGRAAASVAVSLQGVVGVALVVFALVALTSWPWAALAVGVAVLGDLALRTFRVRR